MQRDLLALTDKQFDLLVLGGGIYGAWTAYDAVLRGLTVAIIDKGDWAGGTSSASSKLIHGGLRYLENGDFRLVKKSVLERQMLLQTAPHRVWPLRFGVPIYRGGRLGALKIKIGLAMYDWLAGIFSNAQAHQALSWQQFNKRFPYLNAEQLIKGFTYFDAQTDDARFVLELIDGVLAAGATAANYCEALDLIKQRADQVSGVAARDKISGEVFTIKARCMVDATGRWSSRFQSATGPLRLAKGIHLIMPSLNATEALLLTAKSDGRVFFVIPWYGITLVGTTDTDYSGDPDAIPITEQDIDYLLTETNSALSSVNWSRKDVIGTYSGVRVLKAGKESHPSAASRDWALVEAPNGLLSSLGGKFTSAREDASLIVDAVCRKLNRPATCRTFGKAFPWLANTHYEDVIAESQAQAAELGIESECVSWLVRRYGERTRELLALCSDNSSLSGKIRPELPFIRAELVFSARNEMVLHLDDLLRRRVPLLILAKLTKEELMAIGQLIAPVLGWNASKLQEELKNCYSALFSYSPT